MGQDKPPDKHAEPTAESAHGGRLRILFTEGASLSARQTLYPLGGRYEIDVMDPDPLCQCRFSSFVGRFIRSPSFSKQPAEFLRFLCELVREQKYDVVLPTHEQVYLLSRFRDSLSRRVGLGDAAVRVARAVAEQGRVRPTAYTSLVCRSRRRCPCAVARNWTARGRIRFI